MKNAFTLILLTCFIGSCCSQNVMVSNNKKDTISEIIDPIEEMPFVIERESNYASLSDSLGNQLTGLAALKLYLDDQGIIENFELIKLTLYRDSNLIIDYQRKEFGIFDKKSYPLNVQIYYPFFKDYVSKLKVSRVKGIATRSLIMHLPVRIK